ncbi:DUF1801 domain-containing protein [Leucobacter insecticola]|uniref:DUF1801 domain-containing protein n=1 Tax=Leucobacter insecticola TaxID=2714934 RepID=A0A6G8FIZ9_9MICO|nr:DUF1801 domain-containing protein [Leucobacter insecticola]QIM16347.1 DUF1801 domain-containing protein [Leucobacter insecticola]
MSSSKPTMSPSEASIESVLAKATGPRRAEAEEILEMCRELTGEEPVVWAGRIIGFGEYEYSYDSGHSGRGPLLSFAPGAARHTIYLTSDFEDHWPDLMARLGKHKASKACLYLTRLTGVDREALRELLERSLTRTREEWGTTLEASVGPSS